MTRTRSHSEAPVEPEEANSASKRIRELQQQIEIAKLEKELRELTHESEPRVSSTTEADDQRPPEWGPAASHARLPAIDIGKFGGNPLEFETFTTSFNNLVCRHVTNPADRLQYLEQLTYGEPNMVVRGCRHLPNGFEKAIQLLRTEFGNGEAVAEAYLAKIDEWPEVKEEDRCGFRSLALMLRECSNAMSNNEALSILNCGFSLRKISAKMPLDARKRWREKVSSIREGGGPVRFANLVDFCHKEASQIDDPAVGGLAPRPSRITRPAVHVRRTLSTRIEEACQLCSGNHMLGECPDLQSLAMNERKRKIMQFALCFACLKPGHRSNTCRNRLTCNTCGRRHPTVLHGDLPRHQSAPRPDEEVHVSTATAPEIKKDRSKTFVPMVLVNIKSKSADRTLTVRAILDSGSTATFISDYVVENLQLPSTPKELSLSTMGGLNVNLASSIVRDIEVWDKDLQNNIVINSAFTRNIPFDSTDAPRAKDISVWSHLQDLPICYDDVPVGLLIGLDCPEALVPIAAIDGKPGEPFGLKTKLGWSLCGPSFRRVGYSPTSKVTASRCCEAIRQDIMKLYDREFEPDESLQLSVNENLFLEKVKKTVHFINGHYEIALPFQNDVRPSVDQAPVRNQLRNQERKMFRDPKYRGDYYKFINDMIKDGYIERCLNPKILIPHHGVYHPRNGKFRVVFNASFKTGKPSLNDTLLQGPDLTGSIVGVLTRFRKYEFAVSADIQKMFFQVSVPPEDRDYLSFLWCNDEYPEEPIPYRFTVHPFGAASSPAVANFALRRIVEDFRDVISDNAVNALLHNFYVDDFLSSAPSLEEAKTLLQDVSQACKLAGFNLTKPVSIHPEIVINRTDVRNINTDSESVLGLAWSLSDDSFHYSNAPSVSEVLTRREMLSVIAKVYDPLGLLSPMILKGRTILQEATKSRVGWTEPIIDDLRKIWDVWISDFENLSKFMVPRCLIPSSFVGGDFELHTFADASEVGYGAVCYLVARKDGDCSSALVRAKSRVAPIKSTSIPRLELQAAVAACKLAASVRDDLMLELNRFFWSDSQTVLKYLNNQNSRFKKFVTNRINEIKANSHVDQWGYVPTADNPADLCSRPTPLPKLIRSSLWLQGPHFIRDPKLWPSRPSELNDDDELEVIKCSASKTKDESDSLLRLVEYFSNYQGLKRCVAWLRRVVDCRGRAKGINLDVDLSPTELDSAERTILQLVQRLFLNPEEPNTKRILGKLDSTKHDDDLWKVGGRIVKCSSVSFEMKHQVIVPKCHVAGLILREAHHTVKHLGKSSTVGQTRLKGYWILGASSIVKSMVRSCIVCRKLLQAPMSQKMGDLPPQRLRLNLKPFHSVGVDYFGPFFVSQGRSKVKRYGCIFTCMTSRAIHLEVASSLDTPAFLLALSRFTGRRGQVHDITSDNGTNFQGAAKVLVNQGITWRFNTPSAPHQGGIWEREIRTIKRLLMSSMTDQPFNEETLRTLLVEIEAVMNSRPLCPISDDPNDLLPITPNHLLMIGPAETPRLQDSSTLRCRYRQVQHLADLFWKRFAREYVPSLQQRQRWIHPEANLKVGDLVLLESHTLPRYLWRTGRVLSTIEDNRGLVRNAEIRYVEIGPSGSCASKIVRRPISKLCKLLSS